MNSNDLYIKALNVWGILAQVDMAVEECAELIKALQKRKRANSICTVDDILEEMADVEIMLEQLKIMFDYKEHSNLSTTAFEWIKRRKLKRLEKLLE